jgi:prepilin-type processing-associated H-X9-DG protein
VLIDEDAFSLNDAAFAMTMVANEFKDGPGTTHGFACGLAFADGHSEIHKWRDPRTQWLGYAHSYSPPNPDVVWMQERTSARN